MNTGLNDNLGNRYISVGELRPAPDIHERKHISQDDLDRALANIDDIATLAPFPGSLAR